MNKYYDLCCKIPPKTAWLWTETEERPLLYDLSADIVKKKSFPFKLFLKKLIYKRSGPIKTRDLSYIRHLWMDYPPGNYSYCYMSQKMVDVISDHLTGNEKVEFLPIQVVGPDEERTYYIPMFTEKLDVLNEEKTQYNITEYEGKIYKTIMIPCLSREKISQYNIFCDPRDNFWQIPPSIYVTEDLKKALRKAKLTGIAFEDTWVI